MSINTLVSEKEIEYVRMIDAIKFSSVLIAAFLILQGIIDKSCCGQSDEK